MQAKAHDDNIGSTDCFAAQSDLGQAHDEIRNILNDPEFIRQLSQDYLKVLNVAQQTDTRKGKNVRVEGNLVAPTLSFADGHYAATVGDANRLDFMQWAVKPCGEECSRKSMSDSPLNVCVEALLGSLGQKWAEVSEDLPVMIMRLMCMCDVYDVYVVYDVYDV